MDPPVFHSQGEAGWLDKYHVDGAWVNLSLVDDNDNSPVFTHDYAHFTLPEDTPTGTLLATFTAHDIDGVSTFGSDLELEVSILSSQMLLLLIFVCVIIIITAIATTITATIKKY